MEFLQLCSTDFINSENLLIEVFCLKSQFLVESVSVFEPQKNHLTTGSVRPMAHSADVETDLSSCLFPCLKISAFAT